MFFLSGLPRSGSTLLQAILNQNPDIYVSNTSPLPQLMWDLESSFNGPANEQLTASSRLDFQYELLSQIPNLYYKGKPKYVIDKGRTWTLPNNLNMIRTYITNSPKILVLVRPLEEIVSSFKHITKDLNIPSLSELNILTPGTDPIMRAYSGLYLSLKDEVSKGFLHVVSYSSLVLDTPKVISDIYKFLEIPAYSHTFTSIRPVEQENDYAYGVPDMHHVRPTISVDKKPIDLSPDTLATCKVLNEGLLSLGVSL